MPSSKPATNLLLPNSHIIIAEIHLPTVSPNGPKISTVAGTKIIKQIIEFRKI